ncbi:FAR1-RELATED SEQUENCE 5 isoform [Prunus dulcis]|uniref:FAR1-RELATED SEQUENCE 5 isoform n=1 Tax=Prunus dulcis TaxID=3755 RepID=A0A5E4EWJ9_PRUDU|nr:hypothetical protein L3X38_004858 [Prunus dulcis]VVA20033.1 FAR1-RELATED SEQUENCE 5 isoform [Prunus dulcis]
MKIQECPRLSNMLSSDVNVDLQGEDQFDPFTHFSPTNDLGELNKNNQEKIEDDLLSREFSSHESAYKFYVQYGGERGFIVRKQIGYCDIGNLLLFKRRSSKI